MRWALLLGLALWATLALMVMQARAQFGGDTNTPFGQAVNPQKGIATAADATAIASANVAVTMFAANTMRSSCDIVNTGTAVLYIDFVTTALAGSATSLPIQPGQSYHCSNPFKGAVSAVASAAQPFVAVRY